MQLAPHTWYPTSELSVVRFSGPDWRNFLQGYFTRDTLALTETPTANALCNIKGRVLANGWVSATETHVDFIVHHSLAKRVVEFMSIYLRFAKTDAAIAAHAVHLAYRKEDTPPSGEEDTPPSREEDTPAFRNRPAVPFHSAAIAPALFVGVSTQDPQEDTPPLSTLDFWRLLTEAHCFLTTDETSESYLPQMLDLQNTAVDFDKGCYLGQEVVARAQHRGAVKRRLASVTFSNNGPRTGDSLLDADGKKMGDVVQTSASGLGLAVVRVDDEFVEETAAVAGETSVTVSKATST